MESISRVDPTRYVVLDVETNGLSSIQDDLLSISIFKPDSGELYNRFLPLELNKVVLTTRINGIKTEDLDGLLPLSQEEVDKIIQMFELRDRIILTYGNLDEKFMIKYFQRHRLKGIDYFAFYNFKHEIISSRFSEGNITKDNLCRLYGIDNVQSVHSGGNDCQLEWKLFECMNGHRLLVTNNKVFEFNDEYIVPASFITTHPNFKYYLPKLPRITCESKSIYSLTISNEKIKKFPTNFNGMIIEHLLNSMLHVKKNDAQEELLRNKKKLKYLGTLPSSIDTVPMTFNADGSMSATRRQDKGLEKEINAEINVLKDLLNPLAEYIANVLFKSAVINSQELVIHPERKILATCDLSTESAILEIKAFRTSVQRIAEQLYYEAKGRKCYVLLVDWGLVDWGFNPKKITFDIQEVVFNVKENQDSSQRRLENAKKLIETNEIELISFVDSKSPVRLKCKRCGNEWNVSYNLAKKKRPCPECASTVSSNKGKNKEPYTGDDKISIEVRRLYDRYLKYSKKVEERSGGKLSVTSYGGSRSPAKIKCLVCGREWEARADHLLDRPYCPACKRKNKYTQNRI